MCDAPDIICLTGPRIPHPAYLRHVPLRQRPISDAGFAGGRRSPSPAAVVRVACPYRPHRPARIGPRHAGHGEALSAPLGRASSRAGNAVSPADRIRRPAAHGASGRPLPRLGDAAGRRRRRGRCSTRATSSSALRPRPKQAELPHADVLVMESTFGQPRYRMPPRDETIAKLLDIVRGALAAGKTPVIHAYPLGKSQEVTKILTDARHPRAAAPDDLRRQPHLRRVRHAPRRRRRATRASRRRPRDRHAAARHE